MSGVLHTALAGVRLEPHRPLRLFSISRLEAGVARLIVGLCIDRWGPRRMLLIGLSLMGVRFILLSQINSLETFYFIYIVFLSLGVGLGVTPPISA